VNGRKIPDAELWYYPTLGNTDILFPYDYLNNDGNDQNGEIKARVEI
jgi:hypothetical protein